MPSKYEYGAWKRKRKRKRRDMTLVQSKAGDIDKYFDSSNVNELAKNEEVIQSLMKMIYVRSYMFWGDIFQVKQREHWNAKYLKTMNDCFLNVYVIYKILLTIPVTVASIKRRLSKFKLIKTYQNLSSINYVTKNIKWIDYVINWERNGWTARLFKFDNVFISKPQGESYLFDRFETLSPLLFDYNINILYNTFFTVKF